MGPLSSLLGIGCVRLEEVRASLHDDRGEQTVLSTLLKPCPFCGQKRAFVQTREWGDGSWEARVVCNSCHASTTRDSSCGVHFADGEDITRLVAITRAVDRWNRRKDAD